jgi:iron complex outermembrane recepter protein
MKNGSMILLLCMLLFVETASAQTPVRITGKILLEDRQPATGAVVSLIRTKGAALVKTAIADSSGGFLMSAIVRDSMVLQVSYVGYATYVSGAFLIDQERSEHAVEPLVLSKGASKNLQTITVVGKQPFVERKIDRTVINPDALISNAGGNALEVLEKSPGVQVDMNGNISLQGKPGVMVFIDDKPTYMSSADLANYLRSLPSSTIGSIELMTNPPAKYDAAGNAGIINIKMKKNTVKGFNGGLSTSYGQGKYARTNNSVNLNYRVNKLNLFTNLSYNNNGSFYILIGSTISPMGH